MDDGHSYWKIICRARRNRSLCPSGFNALHDRPHLVCADRSLSHDEPLSPMEFCRRRTRTLRPHGLCGCPTHACRNGNPRSSFIGGISRAIIFVERHFAQLDLGFHFSSASSRAQGTPQRMESQNSKTACMVELDSNDWLVRAIRVFTNAFFLKNLLDLAQYFRYLSRPLTLNQPSHGAKIQKICQGKSR